MSSSDIVWRTNPYTGKSTWTSGDWGGAGWSNGKFTRPGQSADFSGSTDNLTALDKTFRNHDERYQKAQDAYESSSRTDADKAAYWDKLIQADKDMLREMSDLRKSGELGDPPGELTPASPDYAAAAQASLAFWLVLKEREKSRDVLADPRRQYEDGSTLGVRTLARQSQPKANLSIVFFKDEVHYGLDNF